MKTPTLKEKVSQYETFLHRINLFIISGNNTGIRELVKNADNWSYSHRVGNGELSDKKQQQAINNAFWNLLKTPEADNETGERQKAFKKLTEQKRQNINTDDVEILYGSSILEKNVNEDVYFECDILNEKK